MSMCMHTLVRMHTQNMGFKLAGEKGERGLGAGAGKRAIRFLDIFALDVFVEIFGLRIFL